MGAGQDRPGGDRHQTKCIVTCRLEYGNGSPPYQDMLQVAEGVWLSCRTATWSPWSGNVSQEDLPWATRTIRATLVTFIHLLACSVSGILRHQLSSLHRLTTLQLPLVCSTSVRVPRQDCILGNRHCPGHHYCTRLENVKPAGKADGNS